MGDYISRGAVLAKAYWHGDSCTQSNPYPDGVEAVDVSAIEQIPAADVRPVVRGDWIIDRAFGNDVMSGGQMVICSACNKGIFYGKQNFCPNCGADMREVDADG